MKVSLLSHSDAGGGAARAAYRLHRALAERGVESRMRVAFKRTDDCRVTGPAGKAGKALAVLRPIVGAWANHLQATRNPILHSLAFLPSSLAQEIQRSDVDVVNLHWVCGEMMSIADIGRIQRPVVWTLHDSWAFCGSEHHPEGPGDERHVVGYTEASRPAHHRGVDLDAWAWRRKSRAWKRPFQIVTPSSWLADTARRSRLMHDWPVQVIPNVLPVDTFTPCPQGLGRQLFRLPPDRPLVLFGAVGGSSDPIKGWDLLQPALRRLAAARPDCSAVVFGQSQPARIPDVGMAIHYVGRLEDDVSLALLYSAVDVVVLPSRVENLPQVGTEAQACGTPVVAFDCAGLPEVVDHLRTGYLARAFDTEELASGLAWVLEDDHRRRALGRAAREHAVERWSPDVTVPQYQAAYANAVETWRAQR